MGATGIQVAFFRVHGLAVRGVRVSVSHGHVHWPGHAAGIEQLASERSRSAESLSPVKSESAFVISSYGSWEQPSRVANLRPAGGPAGRLPIRPRPAPGPAAKTWKPLGGDFPGAVPGQPSATGTRRTRTREQLLELRVGSRLGRPQSRGRPTPPGPVPTRARAG